MDSYQQADNVGDGGGVPKLHMFSHNANEHTGEVKISK
jgi:hypothetical protein